MAQLLSDLREPPVVGRRYMVPCVEYAYMNRVDIWPTLGPLHHDRGAVGFHPVHAHIDPRFISSAQASHIRRQGYSVEAVAARFPLARTDLPPPNKPHLIERRCRVSSWQYTPPSRAPWMDKFDETYGEIAEPIRAKGGRLLCPHRKVDLSSLPCEHDGTVVCPLHGLRVQVGVSA